MKKIYKFAALPKKKKEKNLQLYQKRKKQICSYIKKKRKNKFAALSQTIGVQNQALLVQSVPTESISLQGVTDIIQQEYLLELRILFND